MKEKSNNLTEFNKGRLFFQNYTNLTEETLKLILVFRNDIRIRKWMFKSEEITLENHFKFISLLRKNEDKKYFAVYKGQKLVACVNITSIDEHKKNCDWGFYLNPKFIGTGLGLEVEYHFLDFLFEDLAMLNVFGWIHNLNRDSIPIQNLFGFKQVDKTDSFVKLQLTINDWLSIPNDFKTFIRKRLNK